MPTAPPLEPAPATPRARERAVEVDLTAMLLLFQREMDLTADQRRHFEKMLQERDEVIEQVQDDIRRANLFDRSDYTDRINAVKAIFYERMGRCLDALQHRRFLEILAQGRFGDAIAFELPPGIEVRD